jgi:acyl carrier protein
VRGFRIEPGEVEAALVGQPGVAEAVVAAYQPEDGPAELVAYLVPARQADHPRPSAGDLRAALRARLPHYLIPTAIVWLPSLPLTPNGKHDRRVLPPPERDRASASTPFAPPRTPTETLLAGLWCDLLGLEQVGRDDSFFDLGGHSLLATRLLARVRATFGIELALRELFAAPTIAALAESVDTALLEASSAADLDDLLALVESMDDVMPAPAL